MKIKYPSGLLVINIIVIIFISVYSLLKTLFSYNKFFIGVSLGLILAFSLISLVELWVFIVYPLRKGKHSVEKGDDVPVCGSTEIMAIANALNKYKRNLIIAENEKKEMESSISERKRKARSQFLSYISHDLRTPMNAIVGFTTIAQSLIKDMDDKSSNLNTVSDCINKISVSTSLLQNLVNGMLDLGVVLSDSFIFSEEKFRIDDITLGVKTVMEQLAHDKHIQFVMRVEKSLDKLFYGDTYRLNQILVNIIGNAIKFTYENGYVECIVKELQSNSDDVQTLRILCIDNGCGMEKDFIPHIYEMFSQEKRMKQGSQMGPGIGMSITKKIVDLMHGSIKIDSEINKGTTIIVEVPLKIAE